MKKSFLIIVSVLFLFSCKDSDTSIPEKDIIYRVQGIEYQFVKCDTIKVDRKSVEYVNETSLTTFFSHKDSTIKYREFTFTPDKPLPINISPDYLPVTVKIPSMNQDGGFTTTFLNEYKEYAPQYFEDGISRSEISGDLTAHSKMSCGKTEYIEKSTFTYTLTLIEMGLGIPLEITGTWEQDKLYFSSSNSKYIPLKD